MKVMKTNKFLIWGQKDHNLPLHKFADSVGLITITMTMRKCHYYQPLHPVKLQRRRKLPPVSWRREEEQIPADIQQEEPFQPAPQQSIPIHPQLNRKRKAQQNLKDVREAKKSLIDLEELRPAPLQQEASLRFKQKTTNKPRVTQPPHSTSSALTTRSNPPRDLLAEAAAAPLPDDDGDDLEFSQQPGTSAQIHPLPPGPPLPINEVLSEEQRRQFVEDQRLFTIPNSQLTNEQKRRRLQFVFNRNPTKSYFTNMDGTTSTAKGTQAKNGTRRPSAGIKPKITETQRDETGERQGARRIDTSISNERGQAEIDESVNNRNGNSNQKPTSQTKEMDKSIEKVLERLYNDPKSPAAFAGVDRLWLEAKKELGNKIRKNDVKHYLEGHRTYTLMRPRRINFSRARTTAAGFMTDCQVDLADFQALSRHNSSNRYLMVVIDVLSKRIFVTPLRTKKSEDMVEGFKRVFSTMPMKPHRIFSDKGTEFRNQQLKKLFDEEEVEKYESTHSEKKAALAERAIRQIKNRLYRYFAQTKTLNWVDVIDQIVDVSNQTTVSQVHQVVATPHVKKSENQTVSSINEAKQREIGPPPKQRNEKSAIEIVTPPQQPIPTSPTRAIVTEKKATTPPRAISLDTIGPPPKQRNEKSLNVKQGQTHLVTELTPESSKRTTITTTTTTTITEPPKETINDLVGRIEEPTERNRAEELLSVLFGDEQWKKLNLHMVKQIIEGVELQYHPNLERFKSVFTHPRIEFISFSPQLGYVLGFENAQHVRNNEIAKYGSDLRGGFASFAVYAKGLTENMIVGNSLSSLLRVVSVVVVESGMTQCTKYLEEHNHFSAVGVLHRLVQGSETFFEDSGAFFCL
ncbi:hypothetical protein niasHS_005925 [Heterodera schachtii]|uniref:Integrase catalytic domain-containing protein n=1 Tax=Heterodera schachtii TaxID=97005 RepID=A0ABD2JN36_HETSC